jgi:hypothetical protein
LVGAIVVPKYLTTKSVNADTVVPMLCVYQSGDPYCPNGFPSSIGIYRNRKIAEDQNSFESRASLTESLWILTDPETHDGFSKEDLQKALQERVEQYGTAPINMTLDKKNSKIGFSQFPHVTVQITTGQVRHEIHDFNGSEGKDIIAQKITDLTKPYLSQETDDLSNLTRRLSREIDEYQTAHPGCPIIINVDASWNPGVQGGVVIRNLPEDDGTEVLSILAFENRDNHWEAQAGRSQHDFPYFSCSQITHGTACSATEMRYEPKNLTEAKESVMKFLWLACPSVGKYEDFEACYGTRITQAVDKQIQKVEKDSSQRAGIGFIVDNRKPPDQQLTIKDYLWS